MHKVFVYGSLLSHMGNHRILGDSKMLGISRSPKNFAMIDLGYYPGVIINESHPGNVVGEVYEVDDNTLYSLDRLEGYHPSDPKNGLYDRIKIDTDFGEAYIYIYNIRSCRRISFVENGDWKTYFSNKLTNNNDY
jgi:gamma-glutamylcyclotransferase (GGCT)/AIG2-like uncharacterized protein YtfP